MDRLAVTAGYGCPGPTPSGPKETTGPATRTQPRCPRYRNRKCSVFTTGPRTATRNRAELMTLISDAPCSATVELRGDIELSKPWWQDLRSALDTLATQPTSRAIIGQDRVTSRLLAFFGSAIDPTVTHWCTAHGDLNWSNITVPRVALLDWESFGTAPAGYDAATLYGRALPAPTTAKQVHHTFADLLDSLDGIRSQLLIIARYLKRVEHGEFADLADLWHEHARQLLAEISPRGAGGAADDRGRPGNYASTSPARRRHRRRARWFRRRRSARSWRRAPRAGSMSG